MHSERPIASSAKPASIGTVLSETFEQYRTYFRFWFIAAACVLIPYLVLQAMADYHSVNNLQSLLNNLSNQRMMSNPASMVSQSLGSLTMVYVMVALNSLIVLPLLFGTILHYVTEAKLFATETTLDESFSRAARRLFFVIVTNVVVWLVICIAFVILVALLSGLTIWLHTAWVAVLGSVILFCAFVWLVTRLAFLSTAAFQERRLMFGAAARSFALTKRKFWRTLAYFFLVYLIFYVTQLALGLFITLLVHSYVLSSALTGLVSLFTLPFLMLARANIYVDSRIRTDAPDLENWLNTPSSES